MTRAIMAEIKARRATLKKRSPGSPRAVKDGDTSEFRRRVCERLAWRFFRVTQQQCGDYRRLVKLCPGENIELDLHTSLLLLDFRYWQARRCGWDAVPNDVYELIGVANRGALFMDERIWAWWCFEISASDRQDIASHPENRLLRRCQEKRL